MNNYAFEKISVTDIAEKAGVGRATFYRYFKRKEDVLIYYFKHNTKDFISGQHYYPRCKADHVKLVKEIFTKFKEHLDIFKLIRNARLEYIYLDFLNNGFTEKFEHEFPQENGYAPYLYAGMLFNVSMAWLDNDCKEPIENLAETLVNAIYFE